LVIRQHVSESLTRCCFAIGRCTLFLQGSKRLRSQGVAKRSVKALEHRPPSLHRLRGATALPGFIARMQPSDFPEASAAALVPLALGLPRGERFFWTGRTCVRLRAARRRLRVRVLRGPAGSRGPSGISQVTGPSVAAAPWSSTPPGASPPSPITGGDSCCLQEGQPPGHPEDASFRGRFPHGSAACLPTHQPGCCHPDCKAGYRPAGLGFGRTGLSPAGRQTKFAEVTARLPPSGPALPGRTAPACSPCVTLTGKRNRRGEQAGAHRT
jgi:hypothetical protein